MLAKRIPIAEVGLDVGLVHDRDRRRAGLVAFIDHTSEKHGDLHSRKEIESGRQNMRVLPGLWLRAYRHYGSRRRAFPDQRDIGGSCAAHTGNRAETLLQVAVERDDFRILMSRLTRVHSK